MSSPAVGAAMSGGARELHLLVDYGGPYPGSFVPMLRGTAAEAATRGFSTTVWLSEVARRRPWLHEFAGLAEVRWLELHGGTLATTRAAVGRLRARLAQTRVPCVLHSHFGTFDLASAFMRLWRRTLAVFWHEHTRLKPDLRSLVRNSARYAIAGRLVDRILCVSPELTRAVRMRGAPPRKLLTFPNAVDLSRFPLLTTQARQSARARLGIEPGERVVLHFGWNWQVKGGDLMLAASDAWTGEPRPLWLTVKGERSRPGGPERFGGRDRVRELNPTPEVAELFAAADVFLSCSRAEGMPYAVLESLAMGLPVVATDLPGHRNVLDGLPGARIVPFDPRAISRAVAELLGLPEDQRAEHARAARQRVAARHSLDRWARDLVDLYERALEKRARHASG